MLVNVIASVGYLDILIYKNKFKKHLIIKIELLVELVKYFVPRFS